MRIALLSEKYPPDHGGLAVSVERLARLLAGAGHSAHVLAPDGRLAPGETAGTNTGGLTVQRFGPHARTDDTLSAWFDLTVAAHRQQPFDVAHGFFVHQAGFVAVYAARYLRLPSVASARGNDLDRAVFDPGKSAHARYALEQASAITTNSRDLARKVRALAPGRPVAVIPNGVDAALFRPLPRDPALAAALGVEGACLGFVGEARLKKGLLPLLLAFGQVAARRPATLLLVGGVRRDDRDAVRIFQKQNPGCRVVVVPPVPPADLPAYYALLDVVVLPSLRDGLPNALLEGMACGCANVATPVGGIPDAIRDGANGCLVPPGDPAALAAALDALLDDPARRAALGAAARATVLRDFTPEQERALNLGVYDSLLRAPSE